MENYKKVTQEINEKTTITKDEIFDYEYSPLRFEFNEIFEFYYEALKRNVTYGIDPCFLFFKNDFSVNATAALLEEKYYVVSINMGTIGLLIEKFKNRNNLLTNTGNDDFIKFERQLDTSINELMYQNALHFTFYHEMAHLIQKSEFLENVLYAKNEKISEYSIKKHLLELDADQYSSLCIGSHIFQFLSNNFGDRITKEQIEKTLIIICSSALFYILSFETNKLDLYYFENSHPHPIIRATCIILHIVNYISQVLYKVGIDIKIAMGEMVKKCFVFSNNIALNKYNDNHIEDFRETYLSEVSNIKDYVNEIRRIEANDKTLASYKWNLNAGKKI